MSIDEVLLWFGLMVPLMLSPGPSNIICAMSGIKQGVVSSIPFLVGSIAVFNFIALMIGFSLGEVINHYPNMIMLIKSLGAMYVIYLSYKFIKPNTLSELSNKKAYTMLDGMISQALNPKAWTMLFTMFAIFLEQDKDQITQVLTLVALLLLLDIIAHFSWAIGGASLAKWIKNPIIKIRVNYFFATSLCLVGLWLLSGALYS